MAIDIYQELHNNTSGGYVAKSDQVMHEGNGVQKTQSEINSNLMQGKIYDAENGGWKENTITPTEPTEATTDDYGSIKIAGKREIQDDNPIKKGETDDVLGRLYGVELDQNGMAFVHVPWKHTVIPIASKDSLGQVKGGDDTGIVIDKDGVIKADFDDTDYSNIGDMTEDDFPDNTVASPSIVNKIVTAKLNEAIYDVLNTPI